MTEMNIWQAAFVKWKTEVYLNTPSVNLEPLQHASHGMTRECELQLLGKIAKECGLYIEIGCGEGFSLLLMKKLGVMCFGFDHVPYALDGVGTSYINCEIFNGIEFTNEFKTEFARLIDDAVADLPIFVYCDNGSKVQELQYIAPLLSKGDIIGTHDYPTEVPEGFDLEGYELITEHDEFIRHYACLQRFWRKL